MFLFSAVFVLLNDQCAAIVLHANFGSVERMLLLSTSASTEVLMGSFEAKLVAGFLITIRIDGTPDSSEHRDRHAPVCVPSCLNDCVSREAWLSRYVRKDGRRGVDRRSRGALFSYNRVLEDAPTSGRL